ncbi:AMP-dependent synthetase [Rubrobacter xylanophilus]|uniref:AMP-dependent synthetase n=2 Tax=Rubrobacter xylanophilus TaxID=49319 RepID=A0A510HGR8_9ACTN|nr:acyl-CoA synthetase [Rubrobacter xylanophilus]BBL79182.1 AMP-dependent synthetase [Rubrobacter xylanophilus]
MAPDDFWSSLVSRMPRRLSYEALYEGFRWELPRSYNIGVDVCDRHARDPGRLALIHDRGDGTDEKWTFRELKLASDRFANALRGLGVGRGDRVAILLSQTPRLPVAHVAAYKLGAVPVPLFALFGEDALRYRLSDSGARVIVTDEEHFEVAAALREELEDLEHVVLTGGGRAGALSFDDLLRDASPVFRPVETGPDDPAIIIYTSGTTGPPKGALHGHRILLGHLPGVSLPHDLAPRRGDLFWTPADWAWIGGLFDVLFPALHWGLPVLSCRMRRFDPEGAFDLMERWGVRNVFLPPTALKMMRAVRSPRSRWRLELETLACGGEPLGEESLAWAREELGLPINEFYGQTECNLVLSNCSAIMPIKPGSMGRPVPGHRVSVIDAEGRELPPGEVGEVAVLRPDPVMMLGYWNNERATEAKFAGDWLRTGDLATRDGEGYFRFVGRDDDVITSSGYRIGPAEIEETLVKHPRVLMAAAVGRPDPMRGEVVKAFVVLKDGEGDEALAGELKELVRRRLGAHEYPREVEFVPELPLTATGKIRRNVLRAREKEGRP